MCSSPVLEIAVIKITIAVSNWSHFQSAVMPMNSEHDDDIDTRYKYLPSIITLIQVQRSSIGALCRDYHWLKICLKCLNS